jgi:alpha-2-macroglobulin
VTYEGDAFASASVAFSAGWYAAAAARDTPELLEVSLDATAYAPGDVARLRIVPDGAGIALVSVLTDRVIATRLVEVDGETVVELPVTDDWGAGAYVTASLSAPATALSICRPAAWAWPTPPSSPATACSPRCCARPTRCARARGSR